MRHAAGIEITLRWDIRRPVCREASQYGYNIVMMRAAIAGALAAALIGGCNEQPKTTGNPLLDATEGAFRAVMDDYFSCISPGATPWARELTKRKEKRTEAQIAHDCAVVGQKNAIFFHVNGDLKVEHFFDQRVKARYEQIKTTK